MTQTEALRLALEALELHGKQYPHMVKGYCLDAITAIKAALEAKDEPVANNWSVFNTGAEVWDKLSLADAVVELTPSRLERGWSAVCVINKDNPPLYTTPPQRTWVGLTDEDIGDEFVRFQIQGRFNQFEYAVKAIEAKLKEKNT